MYGTTIYQVSLKRKERQLKHVIMRLTINAFNEIIFNDENNKNGQSELYVYAKSVRLFTSGDGNAFSITPRILMEFSLET